jgi:hydrogenase maturation protease
MDYNRKSPRCAIVKLASSSLKSDLTEIVHNKRVCLIFLGNTLRGDDQISLLIGEQLIKKSKNEFFSLINAHNTPVNFISKFVNHNPDVIIFVDAIKANLNSGDIILLDLEDFKDLQSNSTHYQGLDLIISQIEFQLERKVDSYLLGIQIDNINPLTEISSNINKISSKIVNMLSEMII